MARRRSNGEGTIYRRKDGRYEGAVYVLTNSGTNKRVRVYGATRAEVDRKLTEAKAKNDQGVPISDTAWMLSDYLDYWLSAVVKPNRRPATYAQCETVVRLYLKPSLGKNQLNKLSVPLLQRWINRLLDEGHSVSKIHVIRKVLSAALTRAEREELIARNAARLVELPPEQRKEVKPWSIEEVTRFLEVVRSHRLYAAYLMLFYGLRKGELLGLRWQDIDATNSKIHIRQQLQRVGREVLIGPLKTTKSRRDLPLLEPVKLALAEYYEKRSETSTELVFTTIEGTPIDPGNFLRDFKNICVEQGLRVVSIHTIRHTVATLLKSRRVPDRDIQLILGHSRITTTQEVYQHDDDDSRRAALQGLAGALLEPNAKKTAQEVGPGLLTGVIDGNGSRQISRQGTDFVDRLTTIISGGAYRIRTDDLFHAMTNQNTAVERATEVRLAMEERKKAWTLGIVAVNLAVIFVAEARSSSLAESIYLQA